MVYFHMALSYSAVDVLPVYFTQVQHLLDYLFYMLCCLRPMKLVCIPAHCN